MQDDGGDIDVDEFMKGIREPLYFEHVPENKIKCNYKPVRLAPGIETDIYLELSAEVPGISECELRIMEASTNTEIRRKVSCTVLTPEQYKAVSKTVEMATPDLEAEGTFSLLSAGVTNIGRTLENDEEGEFGKKPKESNLDDEEIKEIHSLPIVHGVYYNPRRRKLQYDSSFAKVIVNHDYTIPECENETNAHCKDAFFDLEAKGMFTADILKKEKEAMERYSLMDTKDEDDNDSNEDNDKTVDVEENMEDCKLRQDLATFKDEEEVKTNTSSKFPNQAVSDLLRVDVGSECAESLGENSEF